MRAFRVKRRNENGRVSNQRDYVGLDNLIKYGVETFNRYNTHISRGSECKAELYEYKNGKWVKLDEEYISKLFI